MSRIKRLPTTCWSIEAYHPDYYGYAQIDVFVNDGLNIRERVICILRRKDLDKYDDEQCYDTTVAILCNDCYMNTGITELFGLNAGQIIPIQFNGPELPIIPIDWIQSRFWEL